MMVKQANELTDLEKKIAVSMGHEVEGESIARFFIKRWHILRALIHISLSKSPLPVFIHSDQNQDKPDS